MNIFEVRNLGWDLANRCDDIADKASTPPMTMNGYDHRQLRALAELLDCAADNGDVALILILRAYAEAKIESHRVR